MAIVKEYPDYYFRTDNSKTSNTYVFYRNNLSANDFKKENGGYVYSEDFLQYGIRGFLNIVIKTENLKEIFTIKSKKISFRGNLKHFGITIRFRDVGTSTMTVGWTNEKIDYYFECSGRGIYSCNSIKLKIRNGRKDAKAGQASLSYKTSSWSVNHPFNGGGFSPK